MTNPARIAAAKAGHGPSWTREARRVLGLPRRPSVAPVVAPDGEPCARPGCRWRGLNAVQSWALAEIADRGGGLVLAGVGHGKLLIGLLAGRALGVKRHALFVPSNGLRIQALREWEHFREHLPATMPEFYDAREPSSKPGVYVAAYSDLSSQRYADSLEALAPEAIVCDEGHALADPKSARTRRFARYLREHPGTPVVFMSGTITRRSLLDYAHLAEWALGARSPLPSYSRAWTEVQSWADVLDARKPDEPPPSWREEGVLAELAEGDEPIAEAFGRRLVETPGIIATSGRSCNASVYIHRTTFEPGVAIRGALKRARDTWMVGDEVIDSAARLAQHERALAQGCQYFWAWGPDGPDLEWLAARSEWAGTVREALRRPRPGFDTPGFVELAAERGEFVSEAWPAWARVRDRYNVPRDLARVEFFSPAYVRHAADQIRLRTEAWLVFASIPEVGRRLATELKAPWFGDGPADAEALEELARSPEAGRETIVMSLRSHHRGRNLQAWSRVALVGTAAGDVWEQMIGRAHRQGQAADQVDVLAIGAGSPGVFADDFATALEDARYALRTTKAPQLLLDATVL